MSKLQPSFFQFFSFSVYVQVTIQRRDLCREKAQTPLQACIQPQKCTYTQEPKKKTLKQKKNSAVSGLNPKYNIWQPSLLHFQTKNRLLTPTPMSSWKNSIPKLGQWCFNATKACDWCKCKLMTVFFHSIGLLFSTKVFQATIFFPE